MIWLRVKGWLKIAGIGLVFLVIFLIGTFPFSRLGPKISLQLEKVLSQVFSTKVTCQVIGFGFQLPFGFGWDHLICHDVSGNALIELKNSQITALPGYQKVSGKLDKGSFSVITNAGLRSGPTRIEGDLRQIPLEQISPIISMAISKASPFVRDLKFEGLVTGKFELPLKSVTTSPGSVDLEFKDFRLPEQSMIKQIGLKDLPFKRSVLKAVMSAGKISITEVAFLSDHVSGKVEGGADLKDPLAQSMLNLTLKWQIQKSDALLASTFGPLLASAPCPNQDAQGFCARKVTRIQELGMNF